MTRFLTSAAAVLGLWLCLLLDPAPARASDAVLTVTLPDRIERFDRDALGALPAAEFETSTIWTEGPQHFRGVRMVDLLDHLGITSGRLELTAANDYAIEIDIGSFRPDGAILAYERNGAPMTLRSKGPLWLVYPYDSSPDFRSEVIYSNSIWQLDRMALK